MRIVGYVCLVCPHILTVFDYETMTNHGCDHKWDAVVLAAHPPAAEKPAQRHPSQPSCECNEKPTEWLVKPVMITLCNDCGCVIGWEEKPAQPDVAGPSREAVAELIAAARAWVDCDNAHTGDWDNFTEALALCEKEASGGK